MKKIDLGQTIQIIANIGVIAGIIFLVVELQQNNEALSIQTRLDREDVFREGLARRFQQSPDMLRAVAKSKRGDALSDEEILILDWENHAVLTDLMLVYMQVYDDLLREDAIPVAVWRNGFQNTYPRMADYWSDNKQIYHTVFVEWMDENIVNQ